MQLSVFKSSTISEVTAMQIRLSEKINPNFQPFWRAANSHRYLKHVLKGGRGSAKSTHIAMRIIVSMMKNPVTALCIRKVGNTLAESVFEQLKEAIEMLGVSAYWKENKSPLKLTYIPRGNSIIFRGADDPAKIKSIKMSRFPLAIMWIEELAEFKTEDEVTTIENSVLRAELPEGLHYEFYYSYNPPKRKQSWVNKKYESHFIPKNTYVHHSTYLENPYISQAFREEAEHVKQTKPLKYEWEYLGKAIGSGVVPFTNLVFREIPDKELRTFDNIYQGIDWGYGPDPYAFVRMHYDKTRRKLYFLDEHYGPKISNREAAEWILKKKYHDVMTIADSAEPKSISELKSYGIRIKGAKKGPGSVEFGEKWLDDLEEIVIDPKRTPNVAKEFENIDYQVDADGNQKPRLEDKDNHTIDATRYGTEPLRRNGIGVLT
ncbi:PBSX family phage terminase large subunit [Aneurinibacillus thermoaerophilus]|uniref:PBSX family phage terminase large subunit n=2 Tax=Aneurinibacillus thermoaerophilus TaxID=143495 RepID=UPI002E1EAB3C|nr:PBSX family phage terminase large subunit [Aneurinibacillus thermoaerophilus]